MRTLATGLMVLFALAAPAQDAPPPRPAIVLDPGHGGEDQGVRGVSGITEKQLTLEVGQALRSRLEATDRLRVVLTRDDDRGLSADARAAAANASGGHLLVSLHANAAPAAGVTGAEVYYSASDPAGLADGAADRFLIPWDAAQARHRDLSARAAGIMVEALREHVPLGSQAPRPMALRPLVGVNMPAILVEMLYLTSPEQADAAGALKESLVQSLAAGIERFLADAQPGLAP